MNSDNLRLSMIRVDFGKTVGGMKPEHGVNNGPKTRLLGVNMSAHFKDAGIPYSRLHDTEYPYGSGHFVDIPCIFPDFNADPDDPASYDFALTDDYIKAIDAVGTKVFYRLGVSIEHAPKKYHIFPPKDNERWAKICAGIVRHYNEGWAGGFRFGIAYWEIWNEPENPPMWQGTKEEYFRLYVTTANYLKEQFPDIKVGGYAGCGFYANTRENQSDFFKGFITYFTDFLAYISAPETKAPLDFYSWHIYTDNIEEMAAHAEYVQKTLAEYGFGKTENILNEWNYMDDAWAVRDNGTMRSASFVAGMFCALQKSPVDLGAYYDAQPAMGIKFCGIFDVNGPRKPFYAFKAFNELYRLGREVASSSELDRVYVCAASDGAQGAILLSNYEGESRDVTVDISGMTAPGGVRLDYYYVDEANDLKLTRSEIYNGDVFRPVVTLANNTIVLLKLADRGTGQ